MSELIEPKSKLRTPEDLKLFEKSQTYSDVLSFVERLATSIHGIELTDPTLPKPEKIMALISLFDSINIIIDNHPIEKETTSRFGKVEFRYFYDDLYNSTESMLNKLPFEFTKQQIIDLKAYIVNSFGDRERIDYGSGHELNFICFLLCLDKLNYFNTKELDKSIVLIIFSQYLQTMRRLQLLYWLEPAGSHGVWGLDDYHFLPFLFGAAQLSPLNRPRPLSIHNNDYVEEFKDKYFYFACVDFINKVKTGAGSLRWTSPMLDDISGVKTWKKIEEGMFKMYKAEVLGKLPVVQHFIFSTILPCPDLPNHEVNNEDHNHENHKGSSCCAHDNPLLSTWGDCCGIKVPSAIAAKASEQNKHKIPFD
ncbi:Serine/threonine-protein phosphatase 2A activator 2 [Pichia californica]|uniref:Serine/threonine-protein phosphatase 2A activator n=1 Tax=Pichia californica TaxID=460514 RepID=A0A9P7BEN1_9ASCO|nr:Serine/threonine-protein phosphatase 2A activator 2 [[Candida] californica]KAG0689522.1 Serine/threonine-protein phosphatase 2A activator 2 [[Candida] californica]